MQNPFSDPQRPEVLLDAIPEPATVRRWLAESIRRANLLRSLLRTAERKASLNRQPLSRQEPKGAAND